uniref:Uncharacterized protein LOC104226757 isoform X1 n=3 Tax=Nicotiana sylvestris TaxID=4096 RepID=A0A1U7WR01_NICSY|nr:PREDICTED: uncharacterized protein LOC104226757 isoform X1 [Nicotiana sylvestris]
MLNKLFGIKKQNTVAERRIDPSLGHPGRPKSALFSELERSNLSLGRHGPSKFTSFSMPERSNPPFNHHSPPKSASFSVLKRSNPSLRRHDPSKSISFSVLELSNPPLGCHGPCKSATFSVLERPNPPLGRHDPPESVSFSVLERSKILSSVLKIIHAGGIVEYYYMATPAARILEKYPSFILARPDVFRKPWDSVVHKDEILIPGQKYYVVPQRTLKKLRRRIKKYSGIINTNNLSFISQSAQDSTKAQHSIIKTKSSGDKTKALNRRVRFFGIDCKQDSCSVSLESKENREEDHGERTRNVLTWQPTLTVINEKNEELI